MNLLYDFKSANPSTSEQARFNELIIISYYGHEYLFGMISMFIWEFLFVSLSCYTY